MMQDAVTARLLQKKPLVTRLAAVFETATTAFLEALDGEEKATAKLYIQKAVRAAGRSMAADSSRHGSAFQDDDDDE